MSFSVSTNDNQFEHYLARVLGTLCEKQLAGSKSYPLTINDTRIACCQKSGRDPMMTMTNVDVRATAKHLAAQQLITIDHSGRTERYAHCVQTALGIDTPTLAILTVQLLRGPLSVAQLRLSAQRFHDFADNEAVEEILNHNDLFCIAERVPGQRGHRYTHNLTPRMLPPQTNPAVQPTLGRPGGFSTVQSDLNQLRTLLRPGAAVQRPNTNH